MAPGRSLLRAPVRLESDEPAHRVFLPEHDIEIDDDVVLPLEYRGRRYVFVRRVLFGSYSGESVESFLFKDLGPVL